MMQRHQSRPLVPTFPQQTPPPCPYSDGVHYATSPEELEHFSDFMDIPGFHDGEPSTNQDDFYRCVHLRLIPDDGRFKSSPGSQCQFACAEAYNEAVRLGQRDNDGNPAAAADYAKLVDDQVFPDIVSCRPVDYSSDIDDSDDEDALPVVSGMCNCGESECLSEINDEDTDFHFLVDSAGYPTSGSDSS
jgi:hypothetical protein